MMSQRPRAYPNLSCLLMIQMLNLFSINVGYSFRTLIRTFATYFWYMSSGSRTTVLKQFRTISITEYFLVWILIMASNYHLYTHLMHVTFVCLLLRAFVQDSFCVSALQKKV